MRGTPDEEVQRRLQVVIFERALAESEFDCQREFPVAKTPQSAFYCDIQSLRNFVCIFHSDNNSRHFDKRLVTDHNESVSSSFVGVDSRKTLFRSFRKAQSHLLCVHLRNGAFCTLHQQSRHLRRAKFISEHHNFTFADFCSYLDFLYLDQTFLQVCNRTDFRPSVNCGESL